MAIDSANKRASAGNLPWMVEGPIPDGSLTADDRMVIGGEYMLHPWVSAVEPAIFAGWDNPTYACDSNTGTFASEQWEAGETPLKLEWYDTRTEKFRFYGHNVDIWEGVQDVTNILIEIYYDASWHSQGALTFTADTWCEVSIADHPVWVGNVRITSNNTEEYLYVGELQLLNLSMTVPDSVFSKVGGGLCGGGSLIGGGGGLVH